MKMRMIVGAVKGLLFVLIFLIIFNAVSWTLLGSGATNYQMQATFPSEPAGSLDAVYIGGSSAFTFFQGPVAWHKYGITVRIFAADGQPLAAREYYMRYARRMHPDALQIVTVSEYAGSLSESSLHWTIDFFPASAEKYQMIRGLTSFSNYTFAQKVGIYFPIVQYHDRWTSLSGELDFHREDNGLKGAFESYNFLNTVDDQTGVSKDTTARADLSEEVQAYWNELLAYCDRENSNVLFVVPPQSNTEEITGQVNAVGDMIARHGYPVLNLNDGFDEAGLDLAEDYYNARHTNVHGSLKVTDYIAGYLVEHYGFADKRDSGGYADWDAAYGAYYGAIADYLTAEEIERLGGPES